MKLTPEQRDDVADDAAIRYRAGESWAEIATSAAAKNTASAEIQAAIREAVRDYPGTALNRTATRLGTVSWTDWFPGPHQVSDSFDKLTASFLARSTHDT